MDRWVDLERDPLLFMGSIAGKLLRDPEDVHLPGFMPTRNLLPLRVAG